MSRLKTLPKTLPMWPAVVMLLAIVMGTLEAGLCAPNRAFADSGDWVGVVRFSPSPVPGIDAGRTTRFRAELAYSLASAERGFLMLVVFEDTGDKSAKASSSQVPVERGDGRASIDLVYGAPWYGVSSVMLGVVLLKDDQTVLSWTTTQAIPVNPSEDRALFDEAIAAFNDGRFEEAISKLTSAIEMAPKVANYYHWRGDALARDGRYTEAVADYTRVLELAPRYRPSLINRGIARMWMKEWNAAIQDFDAAIELESPDLWTAWAHRGRGISRAIVGQRSEAVADLQAYLNLWPEAKDRAAIAGWISLLQ